MTRKSLFVLAVLVLALVASWYFTSQVSKPSAPAQAEAWLPGLQAEQVKAIEVQIAGQPLVRLERREQGWVLPAKADYPANPVAVATLLKSMVEARKVEPRTRNPELYGRLGLVEPQAPRITLLRGELASLSLLIGNPGQQGGQLVRGASEAQSWLISQRIELPGTELAWLDRRVTALPFAELRELQVAHADGERLSLFRDSPEQAHLQLRDLPKGKRLAFEGAADGMGRLFADLQFADAVPLAQLTFEGKPSLTFSLATFSGKTLKGRFHAKADQHWLLLDKDSDLPLAELPAQRDWAYRIDPYQYQSLAKKLTDLLAQNP